MVALVHSRSPRSSRIRAQLHRSHREKHLARRISVDVDCESERTRALACDRARRRQHVGLLLVAPPAHRGVRRRPHRGANTFRRRHGGVCPFRLADRKPPVHQPRRADGRVVERRQPATRVLGSGCAGLRADGDVRHRVLLLPRRARLPRREERINPFGMDRLLRHDHARRVHELCRFVGGRRADRLARRRPRPVTANPSAHSRSQSCAGFR